MSQVRKKRSDKKDSSKDEKDTKTDEKEATETKKVVPKKSTKVIKLKNTLNQTLPTQVAKSDGSLKEIYIERRKHFTVKESEMNPILQRQIEAGIVRRYN